jgi:hypothetical protein
MQPKVLADKETVVTTAFLNASEHRTQNSHSSIKGLLFLFFAIAINSHISAQNKVMFGVKGGVNISSLQYKDAADDANNPRLSFHAGALAHVHINDTWAIQPEVLASKEGFNNTTSPQNWRILYLNFPVMLQYMFAHGFRLELGPEFGFRVSAQVANGGDFVNATSAYNQLNFSAAGGISYLSKYNIGIGARYTKGLVDVTQGSYNYVSTDVLQLGLFYMLHGWHRK